MFTLLPRVYCTHKIMLTHTCIGLSLYTQYSPLAGKLVQSVAKTSLMCLHESAVSDLILPSDGSILQIILV